MNFLKILLFSFIIVVIFLFLASLVSDQILPQYSKSFDCANTGRYRSGFGYYKCNFITAYLYYIATILTAILGLISGFLPQFKNDSQAKRFRELIFFVVKTVFLCLLLFLIITGIGYIGLFTWLNYLRNNQ